MIRSLFSTILNSIKLTFTCGVILSAMYSVSVSAEATTEETVKAALIYKMGGYVIWQGKPDKITYCFIGEKSHKIARVLVEQKKVGKLPANVEIVNKESYTNNTTKNCSLAYVTGDLNIKTGIVNSISKSVFTITNSSKALKHGFIASIEIRKNKPLLSISKKNLKNSEVSVNSRFLSWVNLI